MSTRQKLILLSFVFIGSVMATTAKQPLNFIFLIADDISQEDIGCYGHPSIKTPNIDRLAKEGRRFDEGYVVASSCSPSRCSVITGRYPHNTGAPELHSHLPASQIMFPKLLQNVGYYTVISGKIHMGPNINKAFNKVSRGKGLGKEGDWVQLLQQRPKDKPFFFWFASTDAHRPAEFSPEAPVYDYDDMIVPPYMVDGPKTRYELSTYAHEVSRFDYYVGQVVEELEKQGVLDNTLIIVIADNGRPFPRAKTRLYDSGTKVPFVAYQRGVIKPGPSSSLVSSIDIAPTILEAAGVDKDQRIQGVSFMPILKDPSATTRDMIFTEHNWHLWIAHERMVRFGDWLYIRNNMPDRESVAYETYDGGFGEELVAARKAGKLTDAQKMVFLNPCPEEELYHVGNDPHQIKNLAENPEYANVMQQAQGLLQEWTEQTGDTIPENPTTDYVQINETFVGIGCRPMVQGQVKHPHLELPGDAAGAQTINHPGPIRLK
ncbi:sulfatase family protein [Pontiella sulfatireligans]|uniref:Arylsulfatase n=1 Tax=Pontiella sulfatireligans TaxID=2750658 RepID=A0A6C2URV2_9BACT|nr:sulfatase [Pontiella sulfatireligans]SPS74525.1 sulfatase S1_8 [Kiritimatiellales bacterium]VGO22683.1 Arylsulfatase [Pontiella sulfatireligans]